MHTTKLIAAAVVLATAAAPSHAQQLAAAASATDAAIDAILTAEVSNTHWEVSSGFDYSRGTYGALAPTTISFVPMGIAYHADRWTFSADTGYVRVKGPLAYIDIADLLGGRAGPSTAPGTTEGVGDTVLGVKYAAYENLGLGLFVDVGGRLRTPTASRSEGLGTGHVGGDLQIDVLKIFGPWSAFANVGYGIRDHRDVQRNPWSGSLGVGRTLDTKLSVGTFYQWRQSVRRGEPAGHEAFAYASYRFTDRVALTLYGATGFSGEGVDQEIGARYSYRWP